eukprot:7391834-Prymnesium_polylepis.1
MEPMDTDDHSYDVGNLSEVECTAVGGPAQPGDLVLDDDLCWPDTSKGNVAEILDEQTAAMRVMDTKVDADPISNKSVDQVGMEEDEGGAASTCLAALPELLQPKALSEKTLKMFTGIERGPVTSGDGKVLEQLSLRVLKAVHTAIQTLNVAANKAVHESCDLLDEQEARAFLAADLMGVELVRGKGANESRTVGEQIDHLLRGEKTKDKAIRSGIRSRKSKARSKPGGEAKLAELDAEQQRKRAEHWDAAVVLDLPDPNVTKVKTERERPPPPPPPPPRVPTTADIAKLDEAIVSADADVVAARRRLERADAAMQECMTEWTEAASTGHHLIEEEDQEEWEALLSVRADLEQEWKNHRELVGELRREHMEADLRLYDAREAARAASEDVAMEKRLAALDAELKAKQAAAAAAYDERRRLDKHRALMELYDTMAQEEIQAYVRRRRPCDDPFKDSPLRKPLAPGTPSTYNLRGDPSTWRLPSPTAVYDLRGPMPPSPPP